MVVGVLRPMILLPITIADDLGAAGLEAILLHELAHISRADFLINLFQSIIETLLFFNPFAWRISAAIRREREHCCDDLVVAQISQPLTYARALVSLAGRQQEVPGMALGATGSRPLLLNRIKRIIEMKKHPIRYGQIVAACSLAAIFITISIACFTPSFAQQGKKKNSTRNTPATPAAPSISTRVIVVDSNGVSHVYKSTADLPPATKAVLDKGLRKLEDSKGQLDKVQRQVEEAFSDVEIPDVPEAPEVPQLPGVPAVPQVPHVPDVDAIMKVAFAASDEALSKIDWNALGAQIDSAHVRMAGIDWKDLNRTIQRSLTRDRSGAYIYKGSHVYQLDPKLAKQIRKEVAAARMEASRAMEESQRFSEESRRSAAEARREMQRAKRRMEQARRELEQAREEMERLQGR
jgi:hypothetical protein